MKIGGLSLLLCVLLAGSVVAADGERIVARHKAVFVQPARRIPSRTQTDAPLLGNGDMGVALGGPPEAQRFWLAKNDFWRLRSQYNTSGPRVFGGVDVSVGELKGATYRVEQELLGAVTRSTFVKGDRTVAMRTWVAATKNVLVIELSATGKSADVVVKLWPAEGNGSDHDSGVEGQVHWAVRKFVRDVDIPSGAAAAMKVIGAKGLSFALRPGKPVTVAVAMDSVFKNKEYLAGARKLVAGLDEAALRSLWKAHTVWWRAFWSKSFVELDDAAIEQRYYMSNYVMGSCSRDPEFPPSIFGTWITVDNPAWSGDYHLNYNHMAPYYGLYSSNHIAQADPYHGPVLAAMPRGRFYAKSILGIRGVFLPVGIGPKGIETTRQVGKTRYGNAGARNSRREDEGLFFGQKSNSAYCVVNLSMRWYLTYDKVYAKAVYPFVREVADFWEDYLKLEPFDSAQGKKGRYVIYKDSIHEGSGQNTNAILSLGLVRNVFETALDMSGELGVDAGRHEKWKHILEHLSGYTTQEMGGKTIFRYSEQGTPWWGSNTLGIQQIYPAGAIGLQSDPKLIKLSHDTITVMGRWIDGNGTNSFFPAAVRVGYDPKIILKHLHGYVTRHCQPNGFAAHNPHGIENCSVVPNTINMMLCMGHQHVLRVFGVWPRDRNARFGNIRAQGAFLVSAELADGEVQYVVIRSERGRPCTLVNPWPDKAVVLHRGGKAAETLRGQRVKFPSAVGEEIILGPEGTSLDELRGRMRPRAPQPTISPPGGVIWGPNMISITAPAGCVVRYTTDGRQPTERSERYTAPFAIVSGATVKARSFQPSLRPSTTAVAVYATAKVDTSLVNTFDTAGDIQRLVIEDCYATEPPRFIDKPVKAPQNPNPGRRGILGVHPKSRTEPCRLIWTVRLPAGKTCTLRVVTSGDPFGQPGRSDYVFRAGVRNGREVAWFKPVVIDAGHPPSADSWRTLEYDVSKHAGRTVQIVLTAAAGGPKHAWHNDRAYFDEIRVIAK